VVRALGFGATLGVACQGLVTAAVRTLQAGAGPSAPPSLGAVPTMVLLGGTMLGIVAAGFATWTALAPIRNPWRQAMLGMIAGLGSFVLSLLTIPLYMLWGRPGLVGLAVVSGGLCLGIGRRLPGRRRAA
jgi:hypothetical protein